MKLGVLHFGDNFTNAQEIVDYVVKIEDLGFQEFWLGEHYSFGHFWTNPEPLLPVLLSYTDKIKIGSAGLLIKLHSPYRVANYYKVLSSIFPDRLTLGYASGETGSPQLEEFLGIPKGSFIGRIEETNYFFNEDEVLKSDIPVLPLGGQVPEQWLLSNSYANQELILKFNLNVCRSLMHGGSNEPMLKDLQSLKVSFFETHGKQINISLAIALICNNDLQIAQNLYKESRYFNNSFIVPTIIGTPYQIKEKLKWLEETYKIDHFILLNLSDSLNQQLEGYQQIIEQLRF